MEKIDLKYHEDPCLGDRPDHNWRSLDCYLCAPELRKFFDLEIGKPITVCLSSRRHHGSYKLEPVTIGEGPHVQVFNDSNESIDTVFIDVSFENILKATANRSGFVYMSVEQ